MKKYWHIALTLLCILVVSSCGKDDDVIVVDEVWKLQNEEAFQAQILNPEFTKLNSLSNEGFILYKVLEKGEGTEPIYYNSTVKMYYKGTFINGTVFDQRLKEDSDPAEFLINGFSPNGTFTGVIDGWTTALQYMHVGDKWEVWIPQQLAYGPSGKRDSYSGVVTVKPYTTLIFEMEVVEIVQE